MPDLSHTQKVYIDTQEKKGRLIFPSSIQWHNQFGYPQLLKVISEVKTLNTGDYTLSEFERTITVDTKRAMSEVWANIEGDDWGRFRDVLDRMQSYKAAAIVLQFHQAEAHRKTAYIKNPDRVMDKLYYQCFSRGIEVWWCHHLDVRLTGASVLRWLLNKAYLLGGAVERSRAPALPVVNGLLRRRKWR